MRSSDCDLTPLSAYWYQEKYPKQIECAVECLAEIVKINRMCQINEDDLARFIKEKIPSLNTGEKEHFISSVVKLFKVKYPQSIYQSKIDTIDKLLRREMLEEDCSLVKVRQESDGKFHDLINNKSSLHVKTLSDQETSRSDLEMEATTMEATTMEGILQLCGVKSKSVASDGNCLFTAMYMSGLTGCTDPQKLRFAINNGALHVITRENDFSQLYETYPYTELIKDSHSGTIIATAQQTKDVNRWGKIEHCALAALTLEKRVVVFMKHGRKFGVSCFGLKGEKITISHPGDITSGDIILIYRNCHWNCGEHGCVYV